MEMTATVNGRTYIHDVPPRLLLVHYLREYLNLTGAHVGCDTSQCGACVIHVNGQSVKSCTMLAVQANGAQVTTIEGLAATAGAKASALFRSIRWRRSSIFMLLRWLRCRDRRHLLDLLLNSASSFSKIW